MARYRLPSLLLLAVATQLLPATAQLSDWYQGIATNYGQGSPYSPSFGTEDGSCGYGILAKDKYPFWSVGALAESSSFYATGPIQGCGMCFEVQCLDNNGQFAGRCNTDPNSRSAVIMITDACPECQSDQLDLQALTFAKLAPMDLGRIDIRYRRVECVVPSDMSVTIDSNAGAGGWVRLEVKQVAGRGAVQGVQIRGADSEGWQAMNNLWGAAWETGTVPKAPLDFRIQDDDGNDVTALGVVQEDGATGELPMSVNFLVTNGAISFPTSFGASAAGPLQGPSSGGSPQQTPCVAAYSGATSGSSPSNCGGNTNSSPPGPSSSPPAPYWDQPPPPSPSPPPPPPSNTD